MFILSYSTRFDSSYKRLIKNNKLLLNQILVSLKLLSLNPREARLKTHKVINNEGIIAWSSRVSGNIRIIWDYKKENPIVIQLMDIGGHSGKNKVYK